MVELLKHRFFIAETFYGPPLYSLTEGSRKAYNAGSATGTAGDVKVTNGNHFYYYKRWGGNSTKYFGTLTVGESPFSLSIGDEVRTILYLDPTKTTGAGLKIVVGKYTGDMASLNAYNTVLVQGDKADGDTFDNTIILTKEYPTDGLLILAQSVADTSGKKWEGDVEIYVNDVRYI